jgi:hypothetical protein
MFDVWCSKAYVIYFPQCWISEAARQIRPFAHVDLTTNSTNNTKNTKNTKGTKSTKSTKTSFEALPRLRLGFSSRISRPSIPSPPTIMTHDAFHPGLNFRHQNKQYRRSYAMERAFRRLDKSLGTLDAVVQMVDDCVLRSIRCHHIAQTPQTRLHTR